MAKTKDFLDYLNTEVGIAPAGSQEELDCAQSLAGVFSDHGLDTKVEEFSTSSLAPLVRGVVMVLLFLGMLLVGFGGGATVIGFVVSAASVVLLMMGYLGNDVLGKLGPAGHSQNVVAFHKAQGEGSSKNRPIVIVAHYDTQRLDLLARPGVSVLKGYLAKAFPYLSIVVVVCLLVQLLGFLPEGVRRTLWVIGLVATLPVLVWGISLVAQRFLPYAQGAVDNKSSVAAMLGVMDDVCNGIDRTPSREEEAPAEEPERSSVQDSIVMPAQRPHEPEMRREVEKVVGVRHGERVLRDLGILPAECEITYIEPEVRMVPVVEPTPARTASLGRASESDETRDLAADAAEVTRSLSADEDHGERSSNPRGSKPGSGGSEEQGQRDSGKTRGAMAAAHDASADEHDGTGSTSGTAADATTNLSSEADSTRALSAAHGQADALGGAKAAKSGERLGGDADRTQDVSSSDATSAIALGALENGQDTSEGPVGETEQEGLSRMADESSEEAAAAPRAEHPAPAPVDDPEWGKSTFVPRRPRAASHVPAMGVATTSVPSPDAAAQRPSREPSFARRAALFDLPDPFADGSDAFSAQPPSRADRVPSIQPSHRPNPVPDTSLSDASAPAPEPIRLDDGPHAVRQAPSVVSDVRDIEVLPSDAIHDENPTVDRPKHRFSLFGRKRKQEPEPMSEWLGVDDDYNAKDSGEKIGSWDNFDDDGSDRSHWKGGAARSAETRGDEHPEGDAELRDAVLSMDDEQLRAHDIWFVATGASSLGHAGIASFVESNRKQLRGAFVVNLECVGAGELTMLTHEGYGNVRRADRRLLRIVTSVAKDLHVNLRQEDRSWADTEATTPMRKSMRAVTLMGLDGADLPAFSQTEADAPESVDASQVADVAAMVTELIRRS